MKFTDAELVSQIENEERLALDSASGELQKERADALDRYRGAPLGNEIEGRSQVVDKTILDTIEWIMPSLARIFLSGDEIGEFQARNEQDEEAAKTETQVCNYYLHEKNDAFSEVNSTLRDALLLKNGYIVGYWTKRYDTMTESYQGLSDEEATMLSQDEEVTVVEHTDVPDPITGGALHDIKIERKKCEEYPAIESTPPGELLVSKKHRKTSLLTCDFVQWRRRVTIGQLRAEGFDVPDDLPSELDLSMEEVARDRFFEERNTDDESPDPSRRLVLFKDTYYLVDLHDTGMPQLWRVCLIEGSKMVVLKEEADIIPFAAFNPIIFPHSHIGSSVYDLINDIGVIKTTLQRQLLDSVYLSTSGRTAVNTSTVNLDDMLVSRPGGIVRVDGPPGESMFPIPFNDATPSILNSLQYMDMVNERRTGVDKMSAGLDPDTLNSTATGIRAIQQNANQRIELIARTLAGGFRDLFLIIHALASKHSTKALQLKLNDKYVSVNPREWMRRTDFTLSVGLGAGPPAEQMQKLQLIAQGMQGAMQMGLCGAEEFYNIGTDIIKAAGYKNAQRFLHPPPMGPDGKPLPPQTPPNPLVQAEQIKAQSAQQIAQGKAQSDAQLAQVKAQADSQVESARMQADMQIQQHKIATDADLKLTEAKVKLYYDDLQHQRDANNEFRKAMLQAATAVEVARIGNGQGSGEDFVQAMAKAIQMPQAADPIQASPPPTQTGLFKPTPVAAAAPVREVVRDHTGKATHVRTERGLRPILRDHTGRATSLGSPQ